MVDKDNKNCNILYVLTILKKYSDKDHILSATKIKDKIKEEYGVDINPKTVVRNIKLLSDIFEYDIDMFEDNNKGYYLRVNPDVDFEPGELSAIINTFAYSNFIPESMSNEIIDKCINMMNVYEQDKYKDYKAIMKNTKTDNLNVFNNIEDLNDIILKKKKIKFDYEHYCIINDNQLDKDIHIHIVSPYKVIYALQKFYLVAMDEKTRELHSFRLDKINNIEVSKEKISSKYTEGDVEFFIKSNVNMIGGDLEKVEIECDNSILDMVIETYGKDIKLQALPNHRFNAKFYTTLKGFKYWCLRNYDTVKVVEPKKLLDDMKEIIKEGE